MVTWMGFGAMAIEPAAWPDVTWHQVADALVSLTVVRMVPVAVAMARTGAQWQTVAFMGWFGPRGLASVVFALLALDRGLPNAHLLLSTVVVTVGMSVFLHGQTSGPLVARYHRRTWLRPSPNQRCRRQSRCVFHATAVRPAPTSRAGQAWPRRPERRRCPGRRWRIAHLSAPRWRTSRRWPPQKASTCRGKAVQRAVG